MEEARRSSGSGGARRRGSRGAATLEWALGAAFLVGVAALDAGGARGSFERVASAIEGAVGGRPQAGRANEEARGIADEQRELLGTKKERRERQAEPAVGEEQEAPRLSTADPRLHDG